MFSATVFVCERAYIARIRGEQTGPVAGVRFDTQCLPAGCWVVAFIAVDDDGVIHEAISDGAALNIPDVREALRLAHAVLACANGDGRWIIECFWPGDETPSLRVESGDRGASEDAARHWLGEQCNNGVYAVVTKEGVQVATLGHPTYGSDVVVRPDLWRTTY